MGSVLTAALTDFQLTQEQILARFSDKLAVQLTGKLPGAHGAPGHHQHTRSRTTLSPGPQPSSGNWRTLEGMQESIDLFHNQKDPESRLAYAAGGLTLLAEFSVLFRGGGRTGGAAARESPATGGSLAEGRIRRGWARFHDWGLGRGAEKEFNFLHFELTPFWCSGECTLWCAAVLMMRAVRLALDLNPVSRFSTWRSATAS